MQKRVLLWQMLVLLTVLLLRQWLGTGLLIAVLMLVRCRRLTQQSVAAAAPPSEFFFPAEAAVSAAGAHVCRVQERSESDAAGL